MKRCTAKNVVKVLKSLTKFLEEADDKELNKLVAGWLNEPLDDMLKRDMFGTEGQCDPRGDHRN